MVYFCGLYHSKDNEKLWNKVKKYIAGQYVTEGIEKIYFQSYGGLWMKKGLETLGAEFVLDGFHIQKYIRRTARLTGDTEETREENRKKIQEWTSKGKCKELERWVLQKKLA